MVAKNPTKTDNNCDMKTSKKTNFAVLWENILTSIKQEITGSNYTTWFSDSKALWLQDGGSVLVVGVPNEFIKNWISKKYLSFINKKLKEEDDFIKNIKIIVSNKPKQQKLIKKNTPTALDTQLSFERIDKKSNLNKRYSFKEFIISPHNEYVCAAAKAVVNKLGVAYNPFFIFGNTGVGKTHLLQAIGNQASVLYPNIKIYYMSSETFINGYYNALQDGTVSDFKTKYREYQLLIVDDTHFFKGKAKMLEEFFHLFNDLYNKNHQIVFSSDRHPHELDGIEERMISRFSSGMVLELAQPDSESREIILKEKAKKQDLELDQKTVDFIIKNIDGGIREIEGILKTISIHKDLKNTNKIVFEDVYSLIKSNIKYKKEINYKDVIIKVCDFFDVVKEDVFGKSRKKEIVFTRQIIMYVLREFLDISYSSIGQKIGNKDHTTVIHSCEKIKKQIESDLFVKKQVEKIKEILNIK